jgi:SAM-dependent methyltransferase
MGVFVRSQHLGWFQRGEAVFLYHELYGFLLEMSADLKAIVDAFAQPVDHSLVVDQFADKFSIAQMNEFLSVFGQYRALVAPDVQELDGLVESVPIKGPWIVAAREADATVTAVTSRGFGPEPYAQPQIVKMDPWQADLWRSIDGEKTVRRLAANLTELYDGDPQQDLGRAVVSIAGWTHSSRQLTRVLLKPRSQFQRLPPYVTSTMPYAPLSDTPAPPVDPRTRNLDAYHEGTIADAEAQFDELETTLSHLFSDPHPALADRTYAQTFAGVARDRGWVAPDRAQVVEVGGGTGRFAAGMVESLRDLAGLHYKVVELAPALQAAQQERLAPFGALAESVRGHAEDLQLPESSVDFLISNEMIADLRMGFVTRDSLQKGRPDDETDPEALALIQQYGLDTQQAPEPVPVQVGATRLVERLAKVLKPGGTAVLTEFGGEKQFPIESTQLEHAEWSVHFGHLRKVAGVLGLQATLEPLPEFLKLRGDVWVLATTRTQFRNLRHLVRLHGGDLQKRAMTPEQFALACGGHLRPDSIEGVQFRPCGERVMGLVPSEFQVLVLRRG